MFAMILKTWFCFGLLIAIRGDILDILRPKTIRIHKFEGFCKGHEGATIRLQNIHLSYSNKIHLVSLTVITKENVAEGLKLKLDLKRCQSREALDSCEKYQTIRLTHLCRIINSEDKPWTPFVRMSEPPMSCPLKKGTCVVKNGTFDGSAFSHLPVAGWYWIVTAYILGEQTNRVLMCVNVEGQIVPV